MTGLETRSSASRKAWASRKRQDDARGSLYGPEGAHRGSAPVEGAGSIKDILERIRATAAAQ